MVDRAVSTSDDRAGRRSDPATNGACARWEGLSGEDLADHLGVPRVVVHGSVASTMDAAHLLAAEGASAGTLVIADHQTAGRGRGGHTWISPPGSGIWLTLIERAADSAALELWGVRCGIHAATAIDPYAGQLVGIKWPNDLYLGGRKLAGILIEARWQEQQLLWVAIGMGINVRSPAAVSAAAGLDPTADRLGVLAGVVAALRSAARLNGTLNRDEMRECEARDIARGRECREPALGRVVGISARGELQVRTVNGVQSFRTGSLVLDQSAEVA